MSVPIPGKLPGVPSEGGQGGSRNFPTCLSTLPITLSSSRDPQLPSALQQLVLPRTRGARRRRQSGGSYLQGKFPAPPRCSPPPGPGLGARPALSSAATSPPTPKAAAAPAAATAKAALPPVPLLAQPTAGPHWQRESPPLRVFPKAPSSRAPARAAPPAPLPALGCGGSWDPLGCGARTFYRVPPPPTFPQWG